MNRVLSSLSLVLVLIWCSFVSAESNLVIVVNKHNPIERIEKRQLIDMYMGKYLAFPNGHLAVTLDYTKGHNLRDIFFETLTGRSITQINAYWSRVKFSGKASPPQAYPTIDAIIDKVKTTPSAIAYIPATAVTDELKVVYRFAK
ncbi:hypothetical protein [Pseudoalteromonas luteoviolacea]|uniref:Phosphate ABC transporter substrate-binding protein n=1 Tax=Pseudoalteromonas luteoviolacea S4054 TaxID=1129367 RepID=A0A0F6AIG3_9GAMM|nr:hypothetical protein [Pseudoalteromonas luteoviolacea]AOT07288.1 hypothetical protein S4054249_05230 [Pseudoalteromonas luteoviolacea]AOT12203.1 hypothetical protein S40542_05230 [Pseudoalteromonas luteoviolacea]AOT17116.1 hypothetical protein S4054_05230 [Pseudoalteromonas luteoviolacea]KKE85701.1 hypothetical protein N479_25045 [Pseudoalteromonas luteoviolacea S4054]KZN70960.1 hypothetical protein N481_20470 [Pseudoalteromonas luteoviolacea S4047-1]